QNMLQERNFCYRSIGNTLASLNVIPPTANPDYIRIRTVINDYVSGPSTVITLPDDSLSLRIMDEIDSSLPISISQKENVRGIIDQYLHIHPDITDEAIDRYPYNDNDNDSDSDESEDSNEPTPLP